MNEQELYESLKLADVPAHLHGGIVRYVVSGLRPGSFLCAVIANDLVSAVCRADDETTVEQLRAVTRWLNTEAPQQCHGTHGIVADWVRGKAKQFGVTT